MKTPTQCNILALDLSLTETGFCVYNGFAGIVNTIKHKIKDPQRMIAIKNDIVELHKSTRPIKTFIEGLAYKCHDRERKSAGLNWYIRCVLAELGYSVCVIPPAEWKKGLFGKGFGNASKSVIMSEAFVKFNKRFKNDNECDAYCIARYGWEFI